MYRSRRRKQRFYSITHDISLTPLIDTALTLLIIFMITAPMMNTSLKVNLPSAKQADAQKDEEIVVHINNKGVLSINNAICGNDQFESKLAQCIQNNSSKTVFVYADQDLEYGHVIRVVDRIKEFDTIESVALASRKG